MQLLNRNPSKRLGSGPTGAEEIKAHPFFQSVNWKSVYLRQLQPPPIRKNFKITKADMKVLQGTDQKLKHIEGWYFPSQITDDSNPPRQSQNQRSPPAHMERRTLDT